MFNTIPTMLDVSIHPELESSDEASGWYACSSRMVIWYSELFVRLMYEITPVMSVTDRKSATIIDISASPVTNDERDGGDGMLAAEFVGRWFAIFALLLAYGCGRPELLFIFWSLRFAALRAKDQIHGHFVQTFHANFRGRMKLL